MVDDSTRNEMRPTLIFDLDGTLIDSREGIVRCMRVVLAQSGAREHSDAELEALIGPPLADIFAALLGDEAAPRAVRAYRECYGVAGLFEGRLYDGIEDALRVLQQRAPALLLATSKPQAYAVRILEHFALSRYFRGVYGCELTGERADKTELLAYLLEQESLPDAVMIGDRKHDVVAARALGLHSVGVTWGFGSAEELSIAGAHTICASVAELVEWYGGYNSPGP